ncbi:MAG: response regulator [Firmicutes bacterium]|nr:response regulator [Bacillota bacterium]
MKKLNVLIAQESIAYRKILQEAVEGTGLAQVVFTASTGQIALERLKQRYIDVVLLSMNIPEKKNLETLFTINKEYPDVYVIIVIDTDKVNTAATVQALQMGALDFILIQAETGLVNNVARSKGKLQGLFTQIMTKKFTAGAAFLPEPETKPGSGGAALQRKPKVKKRDMTEAALIVVAASTGGPAALKYIFQNISEKIAVPILIVQHMPREFTGKLAQSLHKKSPIPIAEAADNSLIKPGEALLAPGGVHLTVTEKKSHYLAKLQDSLPVNGVKPSADVLFHSVARVFAGKKILAIMLTGMGNDGLEGIRELKRQCDCYCLVQSERTCVVYGMPGSVVQAGLADEIRDLHLIPERINSMVPGRSSKQ